MNGSVFLLLIIPVSFFVFFSLTLLSHSICVSFCADPFMFHSIPGVHKAELLHKDVDYSDIAALAEADAQHPRSHQAQEDTTAEEDKAKVSRRTRISFECHPDVILADMFDDDLEQEQEPGQDVLGMGGDDDFEYFDVLLSMMLKTSSKKKQ